MKPILRIYAADIHRIATNLAAAVIVLGLILLPSLYAWFNIAASWDPYSQTGGLPVAVANRDQGASLRGKAVNLGNEIVESLRSNRNIGWTFTGEEQAIRGVEHGDYYACIIIPENFSAKIGTVLSDNPQKAELVYYVNEKINAVSPKITGKGASGIIEQVNRNFIQTANGTIFRIFNEIGIELEAGLPTILTLRDAVFKLEADDAGNRTSRGNCGGRRTQSGRDHRPRAGAASRCRPIGARQRAVGRPADGCAGQRHEGG